MSIRVEEINVNKKVNSLLEELIYCDLRTEIGIDKAKKKIRLTLKEQDRDTRHACAELVPDDLVHAAIMNCQGGIKNEIDGVAKPQIKSITIIETSGSDEVIFNFGNVNNGIWPFTGTQSFKTHIAKGHSQKWLINNFGKDCLKITKTIRV